MKKETGYNTLEDEVDNDARGSNNNNAQNSNDNNAQGSQDDTELARVVKIAPEFESSADGISAAALGWMHFRLMISLTFGVIAVANMIEIVPLIMGELQNEYGTSGAVTSLASAGLMLGGVCGTFLAAYALDAYGRKTTMVCSSMNGIVATIAQVSVPGGPAYFSILVICRFLLGITFGSLMTSTKPYLLEFLPNTWRGCILQIIGLGWSAGVFMCIFIVWSLPEGNWRMAALISSIPLFIFAILLLIPGFMPESPRWLYINGREKEAQAIISKLWNDKLDCSNLFPSENVTKFTNDNQSWGRRISQIFGPSFRLKTFLFLSSYFCLSGGNYGLNTWKVVFLDPKGYNRGLPTASLIILEATAVAFELPGAFALDIFGRKSVLLIGWLGAFLCMSAAGIGSSMESLEANRYTFMTVVLALAQGTTDLIWSALAVICLESFPTYCRGTAFGFSNVSIRLSAAIFSFLGGFVIDQWGVTSAYAMLAGIFLSGFFLGLFIEETANKPVEDVHDEEAEDLALVTKSSRDCFCCAPKH